MKLFVQSEEQCINSHRSEEKYGDWGATYAFNIFGVALIQVSRGDDEIEVGFDTAVGDRVHVLSMIYSTGDTFGRSIGRGEILWVFKDSEIAGEALLTWTKLANAQSQHSVSFKVDGGETVCLSNPASGYFEDCGSVNLQTFIIQ